MKVGISWIDIPTKTILIGIRIRRGWLKKRRLGRTTLSGRRLALRGAIEERKGKKNRRNFDALSEISRKKKCFGASARACSRQKTIPTDESLVKGREVVQSTVRAMRRRRGCSRCAEPPVALPLRSSLPSIPPLPAPPDLEAARSPRAPPTQSPR